MPMMPRPSGKATKIAYKILGKPANMESKKPKESDEINQRLLYEETIRVR